MDSFSSLFLIHSILSTTPLDVIISYLKNLLQNKWFWLCSIRDMTTMCVRQKKQFSLQNLKQGWRCQKKKKKVQLHQHVTLYIKSFKSTCWWILLDDIDSPHMHTKSRTYRCKFITKILKDNSDICCIYIKKNLNDFFAWFHTNMIQIIGIFFSFSRRASLKTSCFPSFTEWEETEDCPLHSVLQD